MALAARGAGDRALLNGLVYGRDSEKYPARRVLVQPSQVNRPCRHRPARVVAVVALNSRSAAAAKHPPEMAGEGDTSKSLAVLCVSGRDDRERLFRVEFHKVGDQVFRDAIAHCR